jgi:hypothetical protein
MVVYMDDQLYGVLSLNVQDDHIQDVYLVANPEKLEHIKMEDCQ